MVVYNLLVPFDRSCFYDVCSKGSCCYARYLAVDKCHILYALFFNSCCAACCLKTFCSSDASFNLFHSFILTFRKFRLLSASVFFTGTSAACTGLRFPDSFRSRIDLEVDIHIVASLDPFRLRADILIENTYKLLVGIILIINGFNLFVSHIFFQGCICRYENAAVHRNKMRGEVQGDRVAGCIGKLLLDLWCVAVAGNAVCLDVFIDLTVEVVHFRSSSCSGSS